MLSLFELDKEQVAEKSPQPRIDTDYLVFDLETQFAAQEVGGWKNIHKMKLSIAVVYESVSETYHVYRENEVDNLLALLSSGPIVVGFNSIRFDYTVLTAYTDMDFKTLNSFDLLQDIYKKLNYRLSLDHLCKETLGSEKSGDGLQALEWWKEGKVDKIIEYCKKDVTLTKELFLFGRQNGYVVFRNKAKKQVRLPVQW